MAGRRKHDDEHENHERWLVSYADFITLLFAFFVVMYAISSVNEGKYRVLSNSLVNAFRNVTTNSDSVKLVTQTSVTAPLPQISRPIHTVSAQEEAARAQLRQRMRDVAEQVRRVLEPLVRGGQVSVNEGAHGISIEINASVLFSPGEAQLSGDAVRALRAVGEVLSQGDFPVNIEGHTDNIPIANVLFPSNWELSAVRASTVARLFIDAGVDARRLSAAGFAEQRPLADNSTPEGRMRNRRVSIRIESMLPPVSAPPSRAAVAPSNSTLGAELPTAESSPPAASVP